MRWIGTAFLILVVAGFVWSIIGDLLAYATSVGLDSVEEDCPSSDEVFNKVK